MGREKKAKTIDEMQEVFSRSLIGVITDYRGLKAGEINDLRRKFREAGVDYKVVKNSLAHFAAHKADREELAGLFVGPVAVALGYDDVSKPAKMLTDYIRTAKSVMSIKGGFLGDRVLTAAEVESLARLPSREVLLAQVVGGIQSPIARLLGILSAPISGMVGVLQARIQQLEGN